MSGISSSILVRVALIVLLIPCHLRAYSPNPSSVVWSPPPPLSFRSGSAVLDADAKRTLDNIARFAKASRDIHLTIDGYSDTIGASGANYLLSVKRAASAKRYLEAVGVKPKQMTANGRGERQSLARPRESRRVEIGIWVSGTAVFEDVPFEDDTRARAVVHLPDDAMPQTLRIRVLAQDGPADAPLADVTLATDDPRVLTPPRMLDVADLNALLPVPYKGHVHIELQLAPGTRFWPVVGLMDDKSDVKQRFLPQAK